MNWLLQLDLIDGPTPYVVWGLTALIALVLLLRRPTGWWVLRVILALLIGALVGVGAVYLVDATHAFGVDMPSGVVPWMAVGIALLALGIVSVWERAVWRKILAILLIILSLLSTGLGVNAAFGLTPTLASMLGIATEPPIHHLPKPAPSISPSGPVYLSWKPPTNLPAKGQVSILSGAFAIPSSAGFKPRDAVLYLPPAALADESLRLPFMVFMMGKPGFPNPDFIVAALDKQAAAHHGLAPIVIIADQLGAQDPSPDPSCTDSHLYGGVATYFNVDIPRYAETKLNVLLDHKDWAITGYSNGGACAFTWAAQHPSVWANLGALSPDEYPGVEERDNVIKNVFGGDAAKFDANKPAAWLAVNRGRFTGHVAAFTVGANDPGFIPGVKRNAVLAKDAGFTTTLHVVPGTDHNSALAGGLPFILDVLYPALGLAPQ